MLLWRGSGRVLPPQSINNSFRLTLTHFLGSAFCGSGHLYVYRISICICILHIEAAALGKRMQIRMHFVFVESTRLERFIGHDLNMLSISIGDLYSGKKDFGLDWTAFR